MKSRSDKQLSLEEAANIAADLQKKIGASIFGQESLIEEALCCLLAGGHILMTGAPGLAKTTLVRVISGQLNLSFGRVQFTPDLLPSDIIGADVLNVDPVSGKRTFEFSSGPIFANLLLADEINRASPRTQSALLEAMQERNATVGGHLHRLPDPFMVFATQNPFESEGTFPLPEAQLDRFLLHTLVDYPTDAAEERMLKEHVSSRLVGEQPTRDTTPGAADSLDLATVCALLDRCQMMAVDDELVRAIKELVRSTRPEDPECPDNLRGAIWYGAGPRAGISLISVSRAFALMSRSDSVRWQHVKRMAKPALRHRLRLTVQAGRDRLTEDAVIDELIERIEARHSYLAKGIA